MSDPFVIEIVLDGEKAIRALGRRRQRQHEERDDDGGESTYWAAYCRGQKDAADELQAILDKMQGSG